MTTTKSTKEGEWEIPPSFRQINQLKIICIMKQTREEIIELRYKAAAVLRKAQCREVNCEIIDWLSRIKIDLACVDDRMTELIGD